MMKIAAFRMLNFLIFMPMRSRYGLRIQDAIARDAQRIRSCVRGENAHTPGSNDEPVKGLKDLGGQVQHKRTRWRRGCVGRRGIDGAIGRDHPLATIAFANH
jgi:hypothetical protein